MVIQPLIMVNQSSKNDVCYDVIYVCVYVCMCVYIYLVYVQNVCICT